MTTNRLTQQITFLMELDKLKHIIRQTVLISGERKENTAEHSWHVAMAALVLAEYADESVDIIHALKMLLVHDIIEIDAGDTFAYDLAANADKFEREQQAAERLYNLLPAEQGAEYRVLWEEFEAAETVDSKFANAIDQIMPLLHNVHGNSGSWKEHNPTLEQVTARAERRISPASDVLWQHAQSIIQQAVDDGILESASVVKE